MRNQAANRLGAAAEPVLTARAGTGSSGLLLAAVLLWACDGEQPEGASRTFEITAPAAIETTLGITRYRIEQRPDMELIEAYTRDGAVETALQMQRSDGQARLTVRLPARQIAIGIDMGSHAPPPPADTTARVRIDMRPEGPAGGFHAHWNAPATLSRREYAVLDHWRLVLHHMDGKSYSYRACSTFVANGIHASLARCSPDEPPAAAQSAAELCHFLADGCTLYWATGAQIIYPWDNLFREGVMFGDQHDGYSASGGTE